MIDQKRVVPRATTRERSLFASQVMSLMGMEKGGPALGQIMERVVDWQLCHPQGAPEECRQYLLDSCGSGSSMQQG